uniref:hypothetical protein n=1 Tax=Candidatus Electrothrix sp. TaxID=2170559 RepID=UPI004057690A
MQANEQPGNATEQVSPATTLHGYHEFDYKFEDRPDPFLPFLGDKSKRPEGEKIIVDPKEVLTGLRKFEAGQLKLGNRSPPSFHTKKDWTKKEDHDSLRVTTFFTRSIHVLSSHAPIQRRVAKNR